MNSNILKLALLNLVLLVQMSCLRIFTFFLYSSLSEYDFEQKKDLAKALWLGVRFDLSVLCYLMIIPFLILAFKQPMKWVRRYYYVMWLLVAMILAADAGYYSYFQDHLNVLIFAFIEDDTTALLWTFWKNYPIIKILILLALYTWFTIWLFRKILVEAKVRNSKKNKYVLAAVLVCEFFLISLGARASLGLFPLGVADTVISNKSFINYISFNGVHAMHRAFKLKSQQNTDWNANLKRYGYDDPKKAFADYFEIPLEQVPEDPLTLLKKKTPKNPWAEKHKPHLVMIVMESMGGHYLKYHSPEFNLLGALETHFKKRPPMLNFFPSHNSTIGSLSSLMIASPQRPEAAFLTESDYLQVSFRSSPANILKSHGYTNRFIYGGNPGWRDVHKFARYQGFESVEGEADIEKFLKRPIAKHDWGVYDQELFEYILKTLEQATTPQFLMVMTTTNHPPYQIPSDYNVGEFKLPENFRKKLTTDEALVTQRMRAYKYSNDMLGKFLTNLESSPVGDRSVVAVTGDHSFWVVNFSNDEEVQKYSVPFYLHTPKDLKINWNPNTYGSHKDIFPTLLPLILSEAEFESVGDSLFYEKRFNAAMHANLLMATPDGVFQVKKDEENKTTRKYKALMGVMDYYSNVEKKKK